MTGRQQMECKILRTLFIAAVLSACSAGAALAQSPLGEWAVENGQAHIRIVSCGGGLWGVISWTKGPPGTDENNPDPAKRTRSMMGVPILINMQPAQTRWEGQVYNAENGETYNSNISLVSADKLRIEGCVLGGLICGGEIWTRVPPEKGQPTDQAVCSGVAK
jgi:uncharacterized protein (DUF2147 family)